MHFRYGSTSHDASEASVTMAKKRLYSRRGHVERIRKTLTVSGSLLSTSESGMTTKLANLESMYSKDGRNAGLYQTDDTLIGDLALDNSSAIGGVRVTGISYPRGDGVYATNLPFQVTLEADYYPDDVNNITEYYQTIRRIGTGGRKRVLIPLIDGPPDIQYPQTHTPTMAVQNGRAMGAYTYPSRPQPLWPDQEDVDRRDLGTIHPQNENGTFTNFGVMWTYYFQDITQFVHPNVQ